MHHKHAWDAALAAARIRELQHLPGALLPVLHAIQHEFGYIPAEAIPLIASALNLSQAEVHGTVSFYRDFRQTPPGRHTLRICRAEACQSMGCEAIVEHAQARLGIAVGDTTRDNRVTLEEVYCLGNCALSPSILLDGEPHGRVSSETIDELLEAAR